VLVAWLSYGCGGANAPDVPTPASSEIDLGQKADTLRVELGELLPTGARITPAAAAGSIFQRLNPGLATRPDFVAGQAVATSTSPDGKTLLVLTSGYNRNNGPTGARIAAESNEYVFVYDITSHPPVQEQALQVPNTFNGIAWNPNGKEFYVTGGVDDNVHTFANTAGSFAESGAPISLGHTAGLGLLVRPAAAGIAVSANGARAVVANYENDSITIVDLAARTVVGELDLRPGKIDPAQRGVPGGEYPFGVAIQGDATAYVSSGRDHEVVVVDLAGASPTVTKRIAVGDQPGKLLLNRDQSRLFVANSNSATVSVVDTSTNVVIEEIDVTAPKAFFANGNDLRGANPNGLALSPDERTLFVTNGGTNSVAVVALGTRRVPSQVVGLVPTGWYPNAVSVSGDGSHLYVVNGKANAGPNPGGCRDTLSIAPGSLAPCSSRNEYVRQLTKAGILAAPVPGFFELLRLTWQTAVNNHFPIAENHAREEAVMRFLQTRIKHVIYVVKENRTYDQVLGDLPGSNGDPSLTLFPEALSPNFHALARGFVNLDNFLDSGETSGDGWNWTTAARTADSIEKTQAPNYAGRGLNYDWEGTNRNINVGFATVAERVAAMPLTPTDPDLLPGTADIAASDAPGGEAGTAYLWDAALRKGLSVRSYGFFGDLARYSLPPTDPAFVPLDREPFSTGSRQFFATKASLQAISDPFFRGYDQKYPDYWRFKEWEREFDLYAASGDLPALELVRLPHDHFGNFTTAIDGVNTVETQMADNDYAVGLLVQKVSESRFADDTLVIVVEDDAQDGGDHVDAHRSTVFVAGPHVKQGAIVSTAYDTVNLVRTIEDVLGLDPLGITDGLAAPMADVFEHRRRDWSYTAVVPAVLRSTMLPVPPAAGATVAQPRHTAEYWQKAMAGQNFDREDALDTDHFNGALWRGLANTTQGGVH
jgi:YVTN family beta-propeller protein